MKYKEFAKWCNQRACDGFWGSKEAMVCITVGSEIQKQPFWRRERMWQGMNEIFAIEKDIVIPTNQKIAEVLGGDVTFNEVLKVRSDIS